MANAVAEGDGAAKVAIDFDASGSTCQKDTVEGSEGFRDVHVGEHTEQEGVIAAVKGLGGIGED